MLVEFNPKAVFSCMNSCYIKQINSVEKEGKLENISSYQTKANTVLHEIYFNIVGYNSVLKMA